MTNIVRYQFSDFISRDNTIEKYRTQTAVRKYASFRISVRESKIDSFIDSISRLEYMKTFDLELLAKAITVVKDLKFSHSPRLKEGRGSKLKVTNHIARDAINNQ